MPARHRGATAAPSASAARGAHSSGAQAAIGAGITSIQPASASVGNPPASARRPTASAAAWGPAQMSPGSPRSARGVPWESCQIASGAKSATVGTGSQSSRPAPRNCAVPNTMPSAMIQSRARAGASDGAQAMTAARRSDALPAAPHDLCATTALWKSQGSRRWTSTAVGRPSIRAVRKVGARAQATPAKIRSPSRSVTRVAANHPPRTASGSARSHSSTMAKDGPAGQSEPSTATTAAKGSAGPTRPTATSRTPHAASLQSAATVCRRGSSPPPPSVGQASRLVKDAMLTTSAASTAQAPPPEKNRSSLTAPPSLP